jgi:hypothetical protein
MLGPSASHRTEGPVRGPLARSPPPGSSTMNRVRREGRGKPMRARVVALAAGMALLGSLGGWRLAGASPDAARVIRLVAMDGEDTSVDLGEVGPSQGDMFVFSRPVFDEDGIEVGTAADACILTDAVAVVYSCNPVITLTNGAITIEGAFSFLNPVFDFSVTGGTGAYLSVSGTAHIEIVSTEPPLTKITLSLSK